MVLMVRGHDVGDVVYWSGERRTTHSSFAAMADSRPASAGAFPLALPPRDAPLSTSASARWDSAIALFNPFSSSVHVWQVGSMVLCSHGQHERASACVRACVCASDRGGKVR